MTKAIAGIQISDETIKKLAKGFEKIKAGQDQVIAAIKAAYEENKVLFPDVIECLAEMEKVVKLRLKAMGIVVSQARIRVCFTSAAKSLITGVVFRGEYKMSWDRLRTIGKKVAEDESAVSLSDKWRLAEKESRQAEGEDALFRRIQLPTVDRGDQWTEEFLLTLRELSELPAYQLLAEKQDSLRLIAKIVEG